MSAVLACARPVDDEAARQHDAELFDYDAELFDRRLLNCCQRHAAVWLERSGVPVRLIFHRALLSPDDVLRQIVVGKRPKYAIQSEFFSTESLASIGVVTRTVAGDRYADIRDALLRATETHGFVLLSGNVFHLAHCVEYRNAHAQHVVVLQGQAAHGDWHLVDDDPASVLRRYRHREDAVRDFYDNNTLRVFHEYDVRGVMSAADAAEQARAELPACVAAYADTGWFYDHIGDLLGNPLDAPEIKFRTLHDAFALLSGSRYCFAAHLEATGWPPALVETARDYAKAAYLLKNLMGKGQCGGRVNPVSVQQRCEALKAHDARLLGELRRALSLA